MNILFENLYDVRKFCEQQCIRIVDFKVIDLAGRWHHLSIPYERLSERIMSEGIGFDGSSYGFLTVEKSDMIFKPDVKTAFIDPFCSVPTLSIISDIFQLGDEVKRFEGDPRYIAQKAEQYLKSTGIADENIIGPEFEFYIFDHISFLNDANEQFVNIDSEQACWNSSNVDFNLGYKVPYQKGYHVDLPSDVTNDLRSKMTRKLEELGVKIKYHHHEVGGAGQVEIETEHGKMKEMADNTMILKYVVKNTAMQAGKTATFMPKPLYKEAGNGMHVHMQLFKDGNSIFYDEDGSCGLSKEALYFIGGILRHACALSGFTNPSTNSYKRLVPGFEAPVSICFAVSNRSAVIRIPGYANTPETKRFEYRPSDATCNPYLAYSALLMAGLDGIENKIDPELEGYGPINSNIFDLPKEEQQKIRSLPKSLLEAADALDNDYEFLLKGGVFTENIVKNQVKAMKKQADMVNSIPHPKEFELYYDL